MTLSELRTQVRRRLIEEGSNFWTDADIKNALNEGYLEMADATEFYERQFNLVTIKGHMYYDLSQLAPDVFLAPRRIWNGANNRWLDITTTVQMDNSMIQWEVVEQTPWSCIFRGSWMVGLWPIPPSDGIRLRVYYVGMPPKMSSESDSPLIPSDFQQGIVEYALYDLLCQDGEEMRGMAHWAEFIRFQQAFSQEVNGRISLDEIPVGMGGK